MDKEIMDCNPPEAVLTVSTQSNTCRSPQEIAAEINAIRRRAARQLLEDSVEVGRLLVEAKSSVGHGEWGGWLEENFQYSSTEANNLMRLYEAYGTKEQLSLFEENRMDLFGRLNKSQAIALLGLPETERAAFVEANPPEDLSVREWERRIEEARAETDEAVRRAVVAEDARIEAERAAREAADKLAEASARAESAENEAAEAKKLKKDLLKARKEANANEDARKLAEKAKADLLAERDALQIRLDDLEKTPVVEVREMTEDERKEMEERIREQIGAETDKLRAENKKLRMAADPVTQKFRRYFDDWREAYAGMKTVIAEAEAENEAETADNLKTAVRRLVAAMREEWS